MAKQNSGTDKWATLKWDVGLCIGTFIAYSFFLKYRDEAMGWNKKLVPKQEKEKASGG